MEAKAQEKLKVKLKAQELFDKVYLELKVIYIFLVEVVK